MENLQHQLSSLYSQVKEERQAKEALSVKLGFASTSYEVARTRDACAVEAEVSQLVAQQVALERSRTLSSIREICDAELDKLGQSTGCFKLTADVADSLTGFSISEIQSCCKTVAPLLTHILSIGDSEPNRGSVVVRELRCVTLMSVLAKQKGMRLLMFQLLLSLMCFARAVSRPVLDTLNRVGICMSYQRTLDWLKEIAKKTTTEHQLEKGQWLLVYDNVNFQKKIRHERLGRKGESWNFTSRLAVKIDRLPPADLVAKGNKPQCSRSSLLPESILPSDEDEDAFFRRCIGEIKIVMVKYFEGLLHQVADSRSHQSSQKSTILPLSLMQTDESVIDNNIDILLNSAKILSWTGSEDHCVVGDQATCTTIRGAKRRRIDDCNCLQRLEWVNESPGDFHFLWECLRVIFLSHWGSVDDKGSLCQMKHLLNRSQVDKDAKRFQQCDEFLQDVLDATLVCALTRFMGLSSPIDEIEVTEGMHLAFMEDVAQRFVSSFVAVPRNVDDSETDHAFNRQRSFVHAAILYRDLRNAIRYEDGPTIVSLWRWWLVYFVATGRHRYSREAANLQANIKANYSEQMAYIVTHNRTVNVSGKTGKGKAIDMSIEHHNLILKNALRNSGSSVTEEHLTTISLTSQLLHDAAVKFDREVALSSTQSHSTCGKNDDIQAMFQFSFDEKLCEKIEGRQLKSRKKYEPAFSQGMQKCIGKQWVRKYLKSTANLRDMDLEREADETDAMNLDEFCE